jgi:hypothetical protein
MPQAFERRMLAADASGDDRCKISVATRRDCCKISVAAFRLGPSVIEVAGASYAGKDQ